MRIRKRWRSPTGLGILVFLVLMVSGCAGGASTSSAGVSAGPAAGASDMDDNASQFDRGMVFGRVLDEEQRPIPNATVLLVAWRMEALTTEAGSFRLLAVPTGRHVLEAHASGHESVSTPTHVVAGEPTKLDFVLPALAVQTPHYFGRDRVSTFGVGWSTAAPCTGCDFVIEFPIDPDYVLVEIEGRPSVSNPGDPGGIAFSVRKVVGTGAGQQMGSRLATCEAPYSAEYTNRINDYNAYNACSRLPVRLLFDMNKLNATAPAGRNTHGVAVSLDCDATWICAEDTFTTYVTAFYYWAPDPVPADFRGADADDLCVDSMCFLARESGKGHARSTSGVEATSRGKAQILSLLRNPAPAPTATWPVAIVILAALAVVALLVLFLGRQRPNGSVAACIEEARSQFERGNDREARRLSLHVIRTDPKNTEAWFVYGATLLKQGQNERAIEELETAMKDLGPQMSGLAFVLCLAYERAGRPESARRWLPLVAQDPELFQGLGRESGFGLIPVGAGRGRRGRQDAADPSYV